MGVVVKNKFIFISTRIKFAHSLWSKKTSGSISRRFGFITNYCIIYASVNFKKGELDDGVS